MLCRETSWLLPPALICLQLPRTFCYSTGYDTYSLDKGQRVCTSNGLDDTDAICSKTTLCIPRIYCALVPTSEIVVKILHYLKGK